uniref:Secreted protein n=1 Tax=Chlamydomonas euryale TaxID=1486919 RepID=A0A7R9VJT5_9CHLO
MLRLLLRLLLRLRLDIVSVTDADSDLESSRSDDDDDEDDGVRLRCMSERLARLLLRRRVLLLCRGSRLPDLLSRLLRCRSRLWLRRWLLPRPRLLLRRFLRSVSCLDFRFSSTLPPGSSTPALADCASAGKLRITGTHVCSLQIQVSSACCRGGTLLAQSTTAMACAVRRSQT